VKKKLLLTGLTAMMMLSLAACGKDSAKSNYDVEKIVTLGDYKGVEVTVTPTEQEIQAEVDALITANTATKSAIASAKAASGDTVNIDFVGKMDGKTFEGGSMEDYNLELGSKSFIDGFEEGLVGTKKGEKVVLNLKFPENYRDEAQDPEGAKQFNGKDVEFTVKVNYIIQNVVPEYNDETVSKLTNGEYTTVAQYNDYIKNNLTEKKKENKGSEIFQKLLDSSKVSEYPEKPLSEMVARVDNQQKATAQMYGMDFATFLQQMNMTQEDYDAKVDETAKYYLSQNLICEAIAKKEDITVTQEEIDAEMQEFVTQWGVESKDELAQQFQELFKVDVNEIVKESALLNKTLKFIGDNAVEK